MEVALLLRRKLMPAESLQAELKRSDRAFQFVGHAVDEIRLPLIQAKRFDREHQIGHHADDQDAEKRRADRQHGPDARVVETLTITQPIVKATSRTIITTPSVIGQPRERRSGMG